VLAADQIGTAERLPVGYAVLVIVVLILLLWAILLILLWGSSRTEGLSNIRRWLQTRPIHSGRGWQRHPCWQPACWTVLLRLGLNRSDFFPT
jgi:hypothetical protein